MQINRDQVIPSRWKKIQFDFRRAKGHIFAYLINRFRWHYYPCFQYVSKFPCHVDIETSSVCNMNCPMCYTTTDKFKTSVKQKFMEMGLFKKIVDECARYKTYSIRISYRGEAFLHKEIIEMIGYAKRKGIKEIASLTNNLALTPELFEKAMHAGLDWLTVSFDGLGDTYEWIRQPAIFKESYEKVKEYKRIKEKAHSVKPVIKMQTIWPAIKDCAKEYFDAFSPYADNIAINPLIDYLHKDKDIIYTDKFMCPSIYQRMLIGSDGRVVLCINDEFGLFTVGDTNRESLYDIWHGRKMTEARRIHKEYKGVNLLEPCKNCYLPRKTQPVVESFGERKILVDKYVNRPEKIGE